MKHIYLLITCLLGSLSAPMNVYAGEDEEQEDSIFVEKKDGSLDIFPASAVAEETIDEAYLKVVTIGGSEFIYPLSELNTYDHQMQLNRPTITSFKFNNKFNHQLFSDVLCDITPDNQINGTSQVAAFTHWLTPSFKRSDARAEVYLNDEERLYSKVSRVKMGAQERLTIAYPGIRILKNTLVSPAEEGKEEWKLTEIPLTADMLSTNAPSNYENREGLPKAVDGDYNTFFHSTWGNDGPYEKLSPDDFPYIDVALPEPVYNLSYEITNRHDGSNRSPRVLSLLVSYDSGNTWTEVQRTVDGDLDMSAGATNRMPVVELKNPASLFRIMMLSSSDPTRNYLCVAELKMFSAEFVKTEGTPAVYADTMVPYGTEYQLNLDWAQATGVPKVYINIDGGGLVSSKSYYLDATIRLDGAGMYPDFAETPVQIRGRGNSSWSDTPDSKNPYRLKFEEKQKPFGLKKGKSWVLLANRQSGSMTSNAIGMYAAGLIGADGANHIVPVELYMNGQYWGSYNFTEKTGLSNNSIELDDETKACFLELDTYSDETRYWSYAYINGQNVGIPVKIKEPEVFNPTQINPEESEDIKTLIKSYSDITTRFQEFVWMVEDQQDISSVVDVESLARFLVANELIINYELMHPKSTFLYHEDVYDEDSKFKWGPVWDLDWSYGYEYGNRTYFQSGATDNYFTRSSMEASAFWKRLRQCGEPLDRAMYKYWSRFIRLYLNELIDYCDDYYAFAQPSLENNNNHVYYSDWDYSNYATATTNAKRWLQQRATAIFNQLTPYELTDEEIMGIPETPEDQPGDDPYFTDGIAAPSTATMFEVYDMRGLRLKQRATYNTWRNGLTPGIYIVNGRKVLVK